jgi:ribose-phosphate pyrophosphokinase
VARAVKDEIKLFTGNSNRGLAEAISGHVGVPLGGAEIGRFSDGEVQVEITENVRGGDVFVIQSICTPTNDNLMELLLMLDAFKRASAKRITAVIPYYGYARQDRKVAPRVPISAKLIADLITTAGAARVLTVDLHAGQIQGFFSDVDNVHPVLLRYLRKRLGSSEVTVIAPDAGASSAPAHSRNGSTRTSPSSTSAASRQRRGRVQIIGGRCARHRR